MATRYFEIRRTNGLSAGPYTIYYDSINPANIATQYVSQSSATNIAGADLDTGLSIEIAETATSIILENNDALIATNCDTTFRELEIIPIHSFTGWSEDTPQLSQPPTPTTSPTPTFTPTPTPTISVSPISVSPTVGASPSVTPSIAPSPSQAASGVFTSIGAYIGAVDSSANACSSFALETLYSNTSFDQLAVGSIISRNSDGSASYIPGWWGLAGSGITTTIAVNVNDQGQILEIVNC